MEPEFESAEELTNFLIQEEALELFGMTENGEITYRFNFDKLEEVFPRLHEVLMEDINESLLELYKQGYIEMEYNEDLEVKFKVTEKGKEYLQKNKDELGLFEWE